MPEGDDTGTTGTTTTTFSQADVDRIVRERVKRERDKYADYDDLKTKAGEADKSKSAMDQLLEKVSGLEERATKAERVALRADVAQAKGLTPAQAKRLQGSTKEELEADAEELLAMFKPAEKDGKDGRADTSGGDGKAGETGNSGTAAGAKETTGETGKGDGTTEGRKALPPSGRPKEKLTSGAVPATTGDKSPAELAESILKNDF